MYRLSEVHSFLHRRSIYKSGKKCIIDEDKCFECYVCANSKICREDAFIEVVLEWPRILRHVFSAVSATHQLTGMNGRGTMEMKTNDTTGRFQPGEVGFSVDVGRPGIGTTFAEAEKISKAVSKIGVEFEPLNPVTRLMNDEAKGIFKKDILKERVLSLIFEFKVKEDKFLAVINTLKAVAGKIDTVFSVGCISRCRPDGSIPVKDILDKERIGYRPNGKMNLGLGRPLA